ncbi:MAG: TetR/AcrR family transcriptional regulator [Pseudomonadota bacterium]
MPLNKVSDQHLLDQLLEVFRVHGYEGASLSLMSEATGLKRASLYHRFPGGKEEMARSILEHADELFASEILAPLNASGDPKARIRSMAKRLDEFYQGGRGSCLLDTLSLGDSNPGLLTGIQASIEAWTDAMAGIAREAGLSSTKARRRAEDSLVQIQGSLVVARITGDPAPFTRTLKALPALLTDPNSH